MTPWEIDRLRDAWTVTLLEETSSPAALARARLDERAGCPAYDVSPDPFLGRATTIQPRDCIGVCPRCGAWFVKSHRGSAHVYCSRACNDVLRSRRRRARLAAERMAS